MEKMRNPYRILVDKHEAKLFGRPTSWWDNIKMDLSETGCEVADWIQLAQDTDQWRALVSMVMKLQGIFLNSWATI